jgi:hypothetical protein
MYGMVLGPALGFVNVFPFRYSFVADHFQYLASLPILAFFVASIFWLLKTRLSPVVISAVVILLVGGPLAVLTRAQSREYVDAETLSLKTIEHNPTAWLAYNNLAMLSLAGNPSKEELEKGLAGFREAMVRRSHLPFQGSRPARSDLHRGATEPDEGHALEELICAPAQAPSLTLSFVAPSSSR